MSYVEYEEKSIAINNIIKAIHSYKEAFPDSYVTILSDGYELNAKLSDCKIVHDIGGIIFDAD